MQHKCLKSARMGYILELVCGMRSTHSKDKQAHISDKVEMSIDENLLYKM